jgi:uncharacterized membrane protein required for colicin V production
MTNWLDIVIIVLIFYSAVTGWRRGLVRQFFDLTAVFASYFVAVRYGGEFIAWFGQYVPLTRWLPAWFATPLPGGFVLGEVIVRLLGFTVLFFATRLLFRLVAGLLHGIFSLPVLGTVNGLTGMILGLVKGLLLALILVAVLSLVSTPFWQQTLEESVTATSINYWWPIVYQQMTDYLLRDLLNTV